MKRGKDMTKHLKEILLNIISPSLFASLVNSFAYYIHEHVAWRRNINKKSNNIRIHPTASIRNAHNLFIGENSHININCCVWPGDQSKIILGDNLLMGPGVSIQSANHGIYQDEPMTFQERTQKDIIIGNDCWICSNVTITAGVTLADGCIVAAGAVVNKSITDPYSIIAGIPAKIIGKRISKEGKKMENLE